MTPPTAPPPSTRLPAFPRTTHPSPPSTQRLNLQDALARLHVVHVTGTKGKGSTCAFVEAVLRASGYTTGMFTSPHLWDVRERIRLNGRPVDRATFVAAFDEVFSALRAAGDARVGVPAYFKFLTLLGLKIFLDAGVDAVVLEVGIGGRLDATNCVPPPVAAGVTALGFDHMDLLGHTLPAIAGEKAGIFKPGARAFTVPQRADAMQALVVRHRFWASGVGGRHVPWPPGPPTPATHPPPVLLRKRRRPPASPWPWPPPCPTSRAGPAWPWAWAACTSASTRRSLSHWRAPLTRGP